VTADLDQKQVVGWDPVGADISLSVSFIGTRPGPTTGVFTTGATTGMTTTTTGCATPYENGCPCSPQRQCLTNVTYCSGFPGICVPLGTTGVSTGVPTPSPSGSLTETSAIDSSSKLSPSLWTVAASTGSLVALSRFPKSSSSALLLGAVGAIYHSSAITPVSAQTPFCAKTKITIRVPGTKTVVNTCNGQNPCPLPTTTTGVGSGGTTTGRVTTTGIVTTTGFPSGCGTPRIDSISVSSFCTNSPAFATITGNCLDQVHLYAWSPATSYVYLFPFPATLTSSNAGVNINVWQPGTFDLLLEDKVTAAELARLNGAFTASGSITVYFTDPPVLFNGIDFVLTIFATGVSDYVTSVTVTENFGANTARTYTGGASSAATTTTAYQDPSNWGRIQVVIPQSTAAGMYSVDVSGGAGCASASIQYDMFEVKSANTIVIDRLDPPYVEEGKNTGILIYANLGTGRPFENVPRVFLNGGGLSFPIKATTFINTGALQGIISDTTAAGDYDLVVINPNGDIGFLAGAVHVLSSAPPYVSDIVPGYLSSSSNTDVQTLVGTGFQQNAKVRAECVDWQDPPGTPPTIFEDTGNTWTVRVTPTQMNVTLPGGQIGAGRICVIRVTNPDGSYFDFSACVTRSPSAKLDQWLPVAGGDLIEARRGHESDVAPVSSSSKYIYAIGGDAGTLATAKTSCEASQLDKFGNLQSFFLQRYSLPEPRTFGYLNRIGRFLYYSGGHSGSLVSNKVFRAEVLDPLKTPSLNVQLQVDEGTSSIPLGTFYYRVSALFAANDVNNPGGESLPGEYLTIYFPPGLSIAAQINLTWNAIPDAVAYRLYRTPVGGLSADDCELLVEQPGRFYTDLLIPTNPAIVPLPVGSTGVWHDTLTNMNTARWGHTSLVTASYNAPDKYYITAHSGKDPAGTLLTSYEAMSVTVFPQPTGLVREKQTFSSTFTVLSTGGNMLPKFMSDGATVDWTDYVGLDPKATLIVIGPGSDDNGGLVSEMEGSYVDTGDTPDHTTWQNVRYPSFQRYGYCMLQAFGLVHMVGGVRGSTNFADIDVSTKWNSYAVGLSTSSGSDPQALCRDLTQMFGCGPFNSEAGGTMQQAFAGCAAGNGLFFLHGGVVPGLTAPNLALKTVYRATQ
jgi:hypothetical protein